MSLAATAATGHAPPRPAPMPTLAAPNELRDPPRAGRARPRSRALASVIASAIPAVIAALAGVLSSGCPAKLPPTAAGPAGELRADAPVPACVSPLGGGSARPGEAGAMARSLREDELWALIFPGFEAWKVPATARTCVGEAIAPTAAAPIAVREGSTLYGGGADRMRVAWLPIADAGARTLGALALYRSHGAVAEVLAIAPLEAARGRTKLGVERLASDIVVTVTDQGCTKQVPPAPCETRTTLYAPRRGRLVRLASYLLEKVVFVAGGEPGVQGRADYHLEASARFEKGTIRISEQLRVSTEGGVELRRIQRERGYAPLGEELVADGHEIVVGPPGK